MAASRIRFADSALAVQSSNAWVNAQADVRQMEANRRRKRSRPYHVSERSGYDKKSLRSRPRFSAWNPREYEIIDIIGLMS